MTNSDKIRALPNEDLAQNLFSLCASSLCDDCPIVPFCDGYFRTADEWREWLESEAEDEEAD